MAVLAAFMVVLMLTAGIYLFGLAVRTSSLLYVLFLETIIGLVLIFPLLIWVDDLSLKQIFSTANKENWYWLAGAAAFGYAGGNYFSLMNLKAVGEKANSLLSPAITATTIILSFFAFGEVLLWQQWLGVVIVLSAVVYFLIQPKSSVSSSKKTTGLISGILCIVSISLTIIFSIKGASNNITLLQAIWMRLLLALVFITPLLIYSTKEKLVANQPMKFYAEIILAVLCQTIVGNYLWFYASFELGISVFQVILATIPLFVYAIDVCILKNSANAPLFLLAALIAAAGICLVVF
jgi:drug/metabolite transporter (DMT)-like permease